MRRKRSVGIVSYFYLPANTSAVQRVRIMARYLPEWGYDATVITTSEGGVLEGDASGIWVPSGLESARSRAASRRWRRLQRFLPYNDRLPWTPYTVEAAMRLGRERPLDALITSSPPLASHLVGLHVHRKLGIPWIADFQDPLVGNPTRNRVWGAPFDRIIENRIFEAADLLIAVTDVVAEMWKRRHPRHAAKTRVIWCGFDSAETMPSPQPALKGKKILLHAGYLYRQRYPWRLLESLDRLTATGRLNADEVGVEFLGAADGVEQFLANPTVSRLRERGCLRMDGITVSRAESFERMVNASHRLLIDIVNLDEVGYTVPAKIFDYVRAGRPILAITDRDSPVERILARSGVRFVTLYHDDNPERTDEKLVQLLELPSESVAPSEWFQDAFDGRHQMRQLGALLDTILGQASRPR